MDICMFPISVGTAGLNRLKWFGEPSDRFWIVDTQWCVKANNKRTHKKKNSQKFAGTKIYCKSAKKFYIYRIYSLSFYSLIDVKI